MKKMILRGIMIVLFLTGIAGLSQAAVYFDQTTHWYEVVHTPNGISWDDAKINAETAGGYLATSLFQAENDFLYSLINHDDYWALDGPGGNSGNWSGPLLGGYYENSSWKWVSGETWDWTNWAPYQPDHPGQENCIGFFHWYNTARASTWNDLSSVSTVSRAYIVEYETDPGNPVPEPGTLILLCMGLLGLTGTARKTRE